MLKKFRFERKTNSALQHISPPVGLIVVPYSGKVVQNKNFCPRFFFQKNVLSYSMDRPCLHLSTLRTILSLQHLHGGTWHVLKKFEVETTKIICFSLFAGIVPDIDYGGSISVQPQKFLSKIFFPKKCFVL